MRGLLTLFLSVSLALSPLAYAEDHTPEIVEKAGMAGGQAAVERVVAGYLDKITETGTAAAVNATAQSAASGANAAAQVSKAGESSIGVGGALIFAVQLGFAVDDFAKAKTDKGKGFATANAVASAITLVNPVVGLVVTAVIIVVELIDVHQSAQFAEDMMKIYTRINEDYRKINEDNMQMVDAEQKRFLGTIEQMSTAYANVKKGRQFLLDNCQRAEQLDSMDKVDSCLKSVVQLYAQFRRSAELSSSLLNVPNRLIPMDKLFEAVKTPRETMEKNLKLFERSAEEMKSKIDESLKIYDAMTAELIVAAATNASEQNPALAFKQLCLSAAHKLTLEGLLLTNPYLSKAENPYSEKLDKEDLKDQMDSFAFSDCSRISSSDAELNRIYEEADKGVLTVYSQFAGVQK